MFGIIKGPPTKKLLILIKSENRWGLIIKGHF